MKRYYSLVMLLVLCSATIASAEPFLQPATIQKAYGVFVLCPFEDPLTVGEVEQMRDGVIAAFNKTFPKLDRPLVLGSIDVSEDTFIAAYGFKIFTNGVTSEYLGLAGNMQSVSTIHGNAQKWNKETEVYKRSDAQILGTWTEIDHNARDKLVYPYGGVYNECWLYFCSGDSSSTYDWYAVKHTFRITPGYYSYSSNWVNYKGYSIQNWSVCSLNPVLRDWDPRTTQTGPTTVYVTLYDSDSGCGTLSWEFDLLGGVVMYNQTDTTKRTGQWEMQFTTDAARRNIRSMKPGTLCRINQPGPGTYTLVTVTSTGIFTDGSSPPRTIDNSFTFSVTYS